jgi:hypothetical protein
VLKNIGLPPAGPASGDVHADGVVDAADFDVVFRHIGNMLVPPPLTAGGATAVMQSRLVASTAADPLAPAASPTIKKPALSAGLLLRPSKHGATISIHARGNLTVSGVHAKSHWRADEPPFLNEDTI